MLRDAIETLGTDLRRAFRALMRRPAYAVGAVVVLAGGIAATTAVFALVLNTLLRPLPFATPDRLTSFEVRGFQGYDISVSIPNYYSWRERQRSFDRFAAAASWGFLLKGESGKSGEVVVARALLGDFFSLLGFQASSGRLFEAAESDRGAERVVVLGDGFWRRRFGGETSLVGKTIELDGKPFTVIGILPPGVGYPSATTEVYFPMGALAADLPWENRGSSFGTRILARLQPGASLATANADLQRIDRELKAEFGDTIATPRLIPLADVFLAERRDADRLLAGLVACFFLIAVVNVLLLSLARAEERRPEMAVRAALGASAAQNRRLLLAEAAWLGTFGWMFGIAGAVVLLAVGSSWVSQGVPQLLAERVRIDGYAIALAIGLAAIAVARARLGTGAGVAPAQGVIWGRGAGGAATGMHVGVLRRIFDLRGALIASEIALTLVLVSLASLLARSQSLVATIDKGFATSGVLTARSRRSVRPLQGHRLLARDLDAAHRRRRRAARRRARRGESSRAAGRPVVGAARAAQRTAVGEGQRRLDVVQRGERELLPGDGRADPARARFPDRRSRRRAARRGGRRTPRRTLLAGAGRARQDDRDDEIRTQPAVARRPRHARAADDHRRGAQRPPLPDRVGVADPGLHSAPADGGAVRNGPQPRRRHARQSRERPACRARSRRPGRSGAGGERRDAAPDAGRRRDGQPTFDAAVVDPPRRDLARSGAGGNLRGDFLRCGSAARRARHSRRARGDTARSDPRSARGAPCRTRWPEPWSA